MKGLLIGKCSASALGSSSACTSLWMASCGWAPTCAQLDERLLRRQCWLLLECPDGHGVRGWLHLIRCQPVEVAIIVGMEGLQVIGGVLDGRVLQLLAQLLQLWGRGGRHTWVESHGRGEASYGGGGGAGGGQVRASLHAPGSQVMGALRCWPDHGRAACVAWVWRRPQVQWQRDLAGGGPDAYGAAMFSRCVCALCVAAGWSTGCSSVVWAVATESIP